MSSTSKLMRLSGLNSGMDTDSLVTALVSSKQTKVNDAKKAQIKLNWKQDAWKDLNSKIYSVYSGKLSSMRFTTAYTKIATKSSSGALSVTSGGDAPLGSQTAKIISMAKSAYLTGGELNAGSKVTSSTDLKDLGFAEGEEITFTKGGETTSITYTDGMTMGDLVKSLKDMGVNANFDEGNQRLFISAKECGAVNDFSFGGSEETLAKLGLSDASGAKKIDGSDAELELNGARFKSSSNTFKINNSTYTINYMTSDDIALTTDKDTSGVYDMIKDFLKEYNTAMNAMTTSYNAASAKGYEPLLDEEKDVMSDSQIDDWEKKVKDSLLRKDSTLNGVMQAMKNAMSQGIEIDGKTYYLSDFGINTPNYFNAPENEKFAYHIDGDKDDMMTNDKSDKLAAAIASDPELVTKFFTKLSQNLYGSLSDKMGSTDYSSMYKVYDDKKMQTEYNSYTSKIADLEKKLQEAEDKYYKKFAAMEKAMSQMNSNTNSLAALFG